MLLVHVPKIGAFIKKCTIGYLICCIMLILGS